MPPKFKACDMQVMFPSRAIAGWAQFRGKTRIRYKPDFFASLAEGSLLTAQSRKPYYGREESLPKCLNLALLHPVPPDFKPEPCRQTQVRYKEPNLCCKGPYTIEAFISNCIIFGGFLLIFMVWWAPNPILIINAPIL